MISSISSRKLWPLLWLLLFGLAFAWRAQNLDAFGLSNDEGAHLMWARLAVRGYPLYSETQAVQAPLFIEAVGWAFRLGGQTVQAGRWVGLVGFAWLAVVLSWLAKRSGGWGAALLALLLLSLSPLIFTYSRLVMAEIPATALAVTAVALALLFFERGRRGWLYASGLALGLSFITKALNPFVVVPIAGLIFARRSRSGRPGSIRGMATGDKEWPALILDGLLWSAGLLLPLLAVPILYEPAAVYDQLVAFRGDLRAAVPGSWPETWGHFRQFLTTHWSYWLLALLQLLTVNVSQDSVKKNPVGSPIRCGRSPDRATPDHSGRGQETGPSAGNPLFFFLKERGQTSRLAVKKNPVGRARSGDRPERDEGPFSLSFINAIWLVSGLMMLAWHTPLFPHHFIVLLPPLILLNAGLMAGGEAIGLASGRKRWLILGRMALLLALLATAFPAMVAANQQSAAIVTGGREQEALKLLRAVSNPSDFLMGDSQLLIFMADRRTPPPLGDVALVAIKAERQTAARMIALTQTYQAPAVVQWSLRLPWLPQYLDWVEANYLARQIWDNDHLIYFGRRLPPDTALPNEQALGLGDALLLRGFELDPEPIGAGQPLGLKIFWQSTGPLRRDYTVFVQLLDEQGLQVAGRDSQPLGGHFPTSRWPVNEIVADVVQLPLPGDLPAGSYTLITGMYLLETLERLPVAGGNSDAVTLTTVTIE